MIRKTPDYLRVVSSALSEPNDLESAIGSHCSDLLRAFAEVTGWQLLLENQSQSPFHHQTAWQAPIPDPFGGADSLLVLTKDSEVRSPQTSRKRAVQLAEQVAGLLQDICRLEYALVQREAELATAVPVVSREADEASKLATRLRAVLAGGAQAVSCEAAAAYLLDDATSELKLRASWGLPADRLLDAPRPLQRAKGDLEALAGQLVVLEEADDLAYWNVPEEFASAVCVPISSPTVPLGTMWMFCRRPREFSPIETNIIEIIAGRIACELEREVLLCQAAHNRSRESVDSVIQWQSSRRALVPPVLDQWQIWASPAFDDRVGNDGYCWMLKDRPHQLMLSVCRAHDSGVDGAMTANFVDGLIRGQFFGRQPGELCHVSHLEAINSALWSSSAGDQTSSVAIASIELESGHLSMASAGQIEVFMVRPDAWELVSVGSALSGADEHIALQSIESGIDAGDILLITATQTLSRMSDQTDKALQSAAWADLARQHIHLGAAELVDQLRLRTLEKHGHQSATSTIIVVKRGAC